ncbi:dockerin type I domain-containing protein [Aeoliella sp.]|uniref:dockerin type I domain-containing protein n=1 Tax=Aeoliella sp. TaxID=2795800 RepID=UPI003CCBE6EB
MKVTKLCRKLAASLVAGGLMSPAVLHAADLNVNLLTNPGFESLDPGDSHVLDWVDGTELGFTYASGVYDNGGPLAGGGSFYFTANGGSDITEPGEVAQLVDLSTGNAATAIGSESAFFQLSGFFSSYLGDGDFGTVQVEFRDASEAVLGTYSVSDGDVSTWTQHAIADEVPTGTQSALVSILGTALSGGPDGYIDNVDFRITTEPLLPSLELIVDRTDGSFTLSNRTGSSVNIAGYEISSGLGALNPASWVSIADEYDADDGGEVDSLHNWSELTDPSTRGDLSEADLESGLGGSLGHTESINLGNTGTWIRNPVENDLAFRYTSAGEVVTGMVTYTNASAFQQGDINTDGVINALDWMQLRSNQHVDLSAFSPAEAYRRGDLTGDGKNTYADFNEFKQLYDAANGAGAFAAMLSSPVAVPEPSTVLLVLGSALLFGVARRATD